MTVRKIKTCRILILVVFLTVLLIFAYNIPADKMVGQQGEPDKPEITIWVDAGNQLAVRRALYAYARGLSEEAEEYDSYYPQLTWNLEDKSYLTGEQLRWELARELEQGRGPDLILMDEVNGVDLQSLMEKGMLLELEQSVTQEYLGYDSLDYLNGTLEQGQMNGQQYILPIYVQCPVVFGQKDHLVQSGIDLERGYGTLEEFLEGVLQAAEVSGKKIFEDACAVDWLEQYAIPQTSDGEGAKQQMEKLKKLLDRVRQKSGTDERFFAPYESLDSGESLLSGCGFGWKSKMAQNIALLGTEQAAFMSVPAWDGEVRAVVTQAVAVNANTAYPKEAAALLRSFQSIFVHQSGVHETYPALGLDAYWKRQFEYQASLIDEAVFPEYVEKAETIAAASAAGKSLLACTRDAVTDAVYLAAETKAQADSSEKAIQKDVLTVGFSDHGMGSEYSLYPWLSDVAERYSDESLYVQLVPMSNHRLIFAIYEEEMEQAGAGVDLFLSSQNVFIGEETFGIERIPADLTPYLSTCSEELETIDLSGKPIGLLYGTEKDVKERAYGFVVSDQSEQKEEAFGFAVAALKNSKYAKAVAAAGCEPVTHENSNK